MNKKLVKVLLKRILSSFILLFLLISFIFVLLRISPGDPVQKYISPELSPELANNVKASFNLDGSILEQYLNFVKNLLSGDLGVSYNYRLPVSSVIMEFLPFTLIFASISFIIQILLGFILAVITSKKINSLFDKFISKAALVFYAIPTFVLGILLIYIFSIQLDLLPSSDLTSVYIDDLSFSEKLLDYIQHLILPLITLSLVGIIIYYKYLRDNMDSVYSKSFILNLRANGINEHEILFRHVIPNAVMPLISIAGVELGLLFSGALITEVIFSLPGMGRLTINAILLRDYPLVVGCAFISGMLIIVTNFVAEIIKSLIDKRMLKESLN